MSTVSEFFDKWEVRWLSRHNRSPTLIGYSSLPPHCKQARLREPNGNLHWFPKSVFLHEFTKHVKEESPTCPE